VIDARKGVFAVLRHRGHVTRGCAGNAIMNLNRRHLIGASVTGVAGALAMSPDAARGAPQTSLPGRDAMQYGVRPGAPDEQTRALQRAIDEAARAQVPLALPPGVYRTGMLQLHNGSQLVGVRGATRLVFTGGASMLQGEGAAGVGLTGITLDGNGIALPARRGLLHCLGSLDIRIVDCEITDSGGAGIWFEQVSGDVSGNAITKSAATAIVSFDALGLLVSRNTILGTGDNGIEILRTAIATTARWSPTTASRTSRPVPAAPDNTAMPSTPFAPAT